VKILSIKSFVAPLAKVIQLRYVQNKIMQQEIQQLKEHNKIFIQLLINKNR
jgi:hypothetical protein